ncbi:MAG: hypothetical protein ACQEXV_13735 [Bacillota bacterium]
MKYEDEKILDRLHEMEKLKMPRNILAGPVIIDGQSYVFEERFFFKDRLKMHVPSALTPMPKHLQKIKYPHEQRPEIILTNELGSVDVTLNRVDQALQDEWVEQLTSGMKAIMKNMNPAHVFYEEKVEEIHGKQIGYFDFKSPALDQPIYHNMFYFELEGKTVMGTFCCPYKQYAEWRDIALQMIHTIQTVDEAEEEGYE